MRRKTWQRSWAETPGSAECAAHRDTSMSSAAYSPYAIAARREGDAPEMPWATYCCHFLELRSATLPVFACRWWRFEIRLTSQACFIGETGVPVFRRAASKRAMGPASLPGGNGDAAVRQKMGPVCGPTPYRRG
jgi:hypothetical protein